jgi:putative chitinase
MNPAQRRVFVIGETSMPITGAQLLRILPNARPVAGVFVPVLNTAMGQFHIVTPLRVAGFYRSGRS